jgi:hypothetical protein
MQALRYASYISKWRFEDFENHARSYLGKGDPEFNFNEQYEQFCATAGIDETPDINSDQRIIVVGSEVKDKLGSVALWLRDHNVDIKIIEVEIYRDGDSRFLQPRVIVPLPVSRFADIGRASVGEISQPWVTDGKNWHLEKRCSSTTKEMFLKLDDLIRDNLDVDGPRWDQKFYVAYRIGSSIWLAVETRSKTLILYFVVKSGSFDQTELAEKLGVEKFDKDISLADKLGLPTSVQVHKRTPTSDRITLRMKEGFNLENDQFIEFLNEAYEAFPE